MFALNIDKETGRILSVTYPQYATDDMPIVEALPDGDISDYLYVEGEYVYEPIPKADDVEPTPEPETELSTDDMAMAILEGVNEV